MLNDHKWNVRVTYKDESRPPSDYMNIAWTHVVKNIDSVRKNFRVQSIVIVSVPLKNVPDNTFKQLSLYDDQKDLFETVDTSFKKHEPVKSFITSKNDLPHGF